MTKLEADLQASLDELEAKRALSERDTEPPPATEPADPVEQAAYQEARAVIRRARANGELRVPRRRLFEEQSDYHKARIALANFDDLIRAHRHDPVWPWARARFIDGLPKLVRDTLRSTGVIA